MEDPKARLRPIIYVRGYAMTRGEIDDTTADPFCGFNLGSTVFRARPDKREPAKKFVFESPIVRLRSDYGYGDVYEDGVDIVDPDWKADTGIPAQSVVIYRYYEAASGLLGGGKTPSIKDFARGLGDLVLRVRELVCLDEENGIAEKDFRCYLVAHSMGGLVCRAFLQNPALSSKAARDCVDKVFTYATPHNGIEMAGINVPSWLTFGDMNNFDRKYMSEYLNVAAHYANKKLGDKRVDWLPEKAFSSSRFFCMIGTNRTDYEAAASLSRTFAGHGSDGLVAIENASVWGVGDDGKVSDPCATAYCYRSHSGYFGIVNSEEAYQNLVRFLFGDIRVDVWLDVGKVRLQKELADAEKSGNEVNALYQFEVLASPRGTRWYLTRRMSEEDSVACRTHLELTDPKRKDRRSLYLSSIFLSNRFSLDKRKVAKERKSLAYSLTLGVRVPDYEIEKRFWPDKHYEGGYLFRDSLVVEIFPPSPDEPDAGWKVMHDWQSDRIGEATSEIDVKKLEEGRIELVIPFRGSDDVDGPGIEGNLRFVISLWNR